MTGRIMIRVPIIAMRPETPGQIINMVPEMPGQDINMEVEMPGQINNMGPEMRELNIIMAVRASHLRLRTAMQ